MTSIPSARSFNFIIGAAKCGTTALFEAFKRHPAVHVADVKEPHFFSRDSEYDKGVNHYLLRYGGWDPARHLMALDASATYTAWPRFSDCPSRVHRFNPDAKLVYLVRDPVERIRSNNQMIMANQETQSVNFDEEVATRYICASSYFSQLLRYRQFFPRESILVVSFDDLCTRPEVVIRLVAKHWDLPESDAPIIRHSHRSNILYSAYFIKKALVAGGWISGGSTTSQAMKAFNSLSREHQVIVTREAESFYKPTSQLQERIRSELAGEMESLRMEYGIDVSKWGFRSGG
jgi:hypothetical protein